MSLVRRLPFGRLRNMKTRGGGGGGSFFGEGKHEPTGILFNESPPAAGHSRKWETWEAPWYFSLGATIAILGLGLPARPDSSLTSWADKQAAQRAN